jgi:predicted alpha-1,2-mannosidase
MSNLKQVHYLKKAGFMVLCVVLSTMLFQNVIAQNPTKLVDPDIGVDRGSTVIGPQLPFGSINPSPDTKDGGTDGYKSTDEIRGFSQLHVSGTGGPGKYGQFMISPQIGLKVGEDAHDSPKANEVAGASSYSVLLTKYNIKAEVTPTHNAAIYRFTYPDSKDAHLLIDLGHCIPGDIVKRFDGYADESEVKIDVANKLITGWGHYVGGWSSEPFKIYFAARYQQEATAMGTWRNDTIAAGVNTQHLMTKGKIGAYLNFNTTAGKPLYLKIAVSFQSIQKATQFLDNEIADWDFERINKQAEDTWSNQLNKITIQPTTDSLGTIFYTALYNTMRMPRDRSGDQPLWTSAAPYWDDQYCVWDTWKTNFPLQLLINPAMVRDNVNAFIDRYQHNGQVMDAFIAGNDRYFEAAKNDVRSYLRNQGGDDIDNVITDAIVKNVKGINLSQAYALLKHDADQERTASYRINDRGWIPIRTYEFGLDCSRTLEMAYNDFCIAQVAGKLGYKADHNKYINRSRNWVNLWNPGLTDRGYSGFIAPKQLNGDWVKINVNKSQIGGLARNFYEGSTWVYSYVLPHEFSKLISLQGGAEKYADRLQFALKSNLIDFGNEPSFYTILSFAYAARPDLASYWIRQNIKNYTLKKYPGDEDSGAMSSWFVFANLGLFPIAGQDIYILTGPTVKKAVIKLEGEKSIDIEGVNVSEQNIYVQSAWLNGKPLNRAWLKHSQLANGATLKFIMGAKPSTWGQTELPKTGLAMFK